MAEAGESCLGHDNAIAEFDPEIATRHGKASREKDVLPRGSEITARMVVEHDHARCPIMVRLTIDIPRIDYSRNNLPKMTGAR